MVPRRTPPAALTKLMLSICGITLGSWTPLGTMRTSPWPTLSPDLNSNTIEPVRPVASLEYSPVHLPESELRSEPATGTGGAGLLEEHDVTRAAARRPAAANR